MYKYPFLSDTTGTGMRSWCGGGFLLASEDFGRMFDRSFPACAFFFFFRAHLFRSLFQDQSTVAQPAEITVAECSLTSCV